MAQSCGGICGPNNPNCDSSNPKCECYDGHIESKDEKVDRWWSENMK